MATNLVHNAIVHNLPEQGTVWVTTSVHPKSVVLTVENTGEKLTPQLVSTLAEPFQRGTDAYAPTTQASASAWRSSRASPKHTTEPSPSPPGPPAGSASRCNYPPRHRTPASTSFRTSTRPDPMAMSFAVVCGLYPTPDEPHLKESIMPSTYTFDVFSSLDGFGTADSSGNWTGYWGKQGPELLDHRLALYGKEQRMVFGANTYRAFAD